MQVSRRLALLGALLAVCLVGATAAATPSIAARPSTDRSSQQAAVMGDVTEPVQIQARYYIRPDWSGCSLKLRSQPTASSALLETVYGCGHNIWCWYQDCGARVQGGSYSCDGRSDTVWVPVATTGGQKAWTLNWQGAGCSKRVYI
jgi:hypothetical protein